MSSPPIVSTPFHDRDNTASSPPGSQYSIDFNALSRTDAGSDDTPIAGRHIKQIRSEDIDGPSDFTINMEKWMRGSLGHARQQSADKSHLQANSSPLVRSGSLITRAEHTPVRSKTPGSNVSMTPTLNRQRASPKQSGATGRSPNDVSRTSKPSTAQHNLLQPTVEDFHSELTPNKVTSNEPLPGLATESTVVPTRSEPSSPDHVAQRASASASDPALLELQAQLSDLRNRLHDSERTVLTYRQKLEDSEQTIRTQNADAQRRQDEIAEVTAARETAVTDAKRHKSELDEMCESEDAEMHNLRAQLRDLRTRETSHVDEKSRIEIERLRSGYVKAEETHKARIAELESLLATNSRGSDTSELASLRSDLASERASRERVESELQSANEELDLLRDLSRFDDIPIVVEPETKPGSTETETSLQAEVEKLKTQLHELEKSKDEILNDKVELQSRLNTMHSDLDMFKHELHILRSERQDHEHAHQELETSYHSLQDELCAIRDANTAFDKKVSNAVKRREEYWAEQKRRWDLERESVDAERAMMGKALMRQWGREECGPTILQEGRQAFVYQFGRA